MNIVRHAFLLGLVGLLAGCVTPTETSTKSVWVSFSKDGTEFTDWQMAELPVFNGPDKMKGFGRIEARARVNEKQAKFVRVKVENYGVLPEWHPYAGQKAWIMVDEVTIE